MMSKLQEQLEFNYGGRGGGANHKIIGLTIKYKSDHCFLINIKTQMIGSELHD